MLKLRYKASLVRLLAFLFIAAISMSPTIGIPIPPSPHSGTYSAEAIGNGAYSYGGSNN